MYRERVHLAPLAYAPYAAVLALLEITSLLGVARNGSIFRTLSQSRMLSQKERGILGARVFLGSTVLKESSRRWFVWLALPHILLPLRSRSEIKLILVTRLAGEIGISSVMEAFFSLGPYEAVSPKKQEELNKAVAKLVPIMRTDFNKKLGRTLSGPEEITLTKITRVTLDEAIDEIVLDRWKQYFLRYFEADELEELYRFHKTSAARKYMQMAMDSQRIMSNDVSDESMRDRYILSFAKKLKNEDPSLYSALFPLPNSPIGGKEEPCPPNIKSVLGRCFEFTVPQERLP